MHPRLDTLTVDLAEPLADIRALLPLMLSPGDAGRSQGIVDSLAVTAVGVEADAVTLTARIDIPAVPAAMPTVSVR